MGFRDMGVVVGSRGWALFARMILGLGLTSGKPTRQAGTYAYVAFLKPPFALGLPIDIFGRSEAHSLYA